MRDTELMEWVLGDFPKQSEAVSQARTGITFSGEHFDLECKIIFAHACFWI